MAAGYGGLKVGAGVLVCYVLVQFNFSPEVFPNPSNF
jgi:cytochrome P450